MKPLALTVCAFGPFATEQSVPFAELAPLGLYAVTGPTGSGKTTLFDAMTYALYGGLPGDRPTSEIRSHHAADDTVTRVTLEFEVAGQRWRVERTPEQHVQGARKVRKQHAEAHLARWTSGAWRGVESGPRRVDPRIEELIGLTLPQFARVVLLPQGRFQQFLVTGTKERKVLLRHLFGTELYERAVEALGVRAGALRDQVAAADGAIRHHLANATRALTAAAELLHERGDAEPADVPAPAGLADVSDASDPAAADETIDAARRVLGRLRPRADDAARQLQQLEDQQARAQLAAQRATDLAARWDRRAALHERRKRHEAQRPTVLADVDRAERARRAAPVLAAHAAATRSATALDRSRQRAEHAHAQLAADLATSGLAAGADAQTVATRLAAVDAALAASAELDRVEHDAAAIERDAHTAAQASASNDAAIATTAERLHTAEHRAAVLRDEASSLPRLESAATETAAIVDRRGAYDRAEHAAIQAIDASARASDAVGELTKRFVAGIAPRLAASLEAGEPCPVCGAIDHPHPATGSGDDAVTTADLAQAQARAHAAMVTQGRAAADLQRLRDQLGDDATRPLGELVAAADAAAAAFAQAQRAAAGAQAADQEIGSLQTEHQRLLTLGNELTVHTARLAERREQLAARRAQLGPTLQEWAGVELDQVRAALRRAADAGRELTQLERDVAVALARHDDAIDARARALDASGFGTLDDAVTAALTDDELRQIDAAADRWHRDGHAIDAALAALAADDLPDDRPDVAQATDEAETRTAALRTARERLIRAQHHLEGAADALEAATAAHTAASEVRAAHHEAETIARTCAGQGPGRIALESWVLAAELDRVADAANVHLGRMSAGRYQLIRTDDAGHAGKQAGLDLAILDSHTGRQRPTTTLSGGEQFQASLALALGLADVVANTERASAAGFEALFIDEGFGSLDADALDLAISALDDLRGGGRAVGIITHVDALKAALPVGVEIRPRRDAHGSTVVIGASAPVAARAGTFQ